MAGGLVLLTGASGFVGANVARALVESGRDVRLFSRKESDRRNFPQSPRIQVFEGDLRDAQAVKKAVIGCDQVYHTAADYRFWALDPQEIYDSNVKGTENLLSAAFESGVSKFVYTSSVGTIGLADQSRPSNENSPDHPLASVNHYKKSKFLAEKVAFEYSKRGLPVIVVNPSTPIGPWDRKPTPTGKIIVDFVTGKLPAYVKTGLNFVHVKDVAIGHLLAAEKGRVGERYILGHQNLSMQEFLTIISNLTGRRAPRFRIPYSIAWLAGYISTTYADRISKRPPAVPLEAVEMSKNRMFFDSAKAINELGLPQTPINVAVQEALDWFLENGFFNP